MVRSSRASDDYAEGYDDGERNATSRLTRGKIDWSLVFWGFLAGAIIGPMLSKLEPFRQQSLPEE